MVRKPQTYSIGEAEERRLKLKSYAQQLEELAEKRGKSQRESGVLDQKVSDESKDPLGWKSRKNDDGTPAWSKAALNSKLVITDGLACVGHHNWKVLRRTPYIFEPLAQECYITTALLGSDVKQEKTLPKGEVAILDLDRNVKD